MSIFNKLFDYELPSSITYIFDKIGSFLDGVVLFFLNFYTIVLILLFIILFILYFALPVTAYGYWTRYKKQIYTFFKL